MRTICLMAILTTPLAAFPVPKAAKTTNIADTTWSGDGIVAPTRYTFHANGMMSYSYNATTHTTATWKQDGSKIYWECNNKYCEFEGTIDGKEIRGKTWNVTGLKKDLKFTLEEAK